KELNMNYYDLSFDLTNVNEVKEMINQAKEILTQDNVTTIYIVNNAGILEPMDQANEIDSEKLIKHYKINALTPMMITNKLLNMNYYDLSFNLTNMNEEKEMINQAKEILNQDNVTNIYIVNNAGILKPMDQAKEIDSEKLIKHYQIIALTPMMITNTFLKL